MIAVGEREVKVFFTFSSTPNQTISTPKLGVSMHRMVYKVPEMSCNSPAHHNGKNSLIKKQKSFYFYLEDFWFLDGNPYIYDHLPRWRLNCKNSNASLYLSCVIFYIIFIYDSENIFPQRLLWNLFSSSPVINTLFGETAVITGS